MPLKSDFLEASLLDKSSSLADLSVTRIIDLFVNLVTFKCGTKEAFLLNLSSSIVSALGVATL